MALFEFTKKAIAKLSRKKIVKLELRKQLITLFFPLILVTIGGILAITNYTPNTFLSGWDALHPEFNLDLNLFRTLFGVFRTEQGLGALASHAHMVELPKILLFYVLNLAFPVDTLRYLYTFLCLILGPVGMYFFLDRVVIKKRLPSFLGALFYLLNIGTYQTFLVPFEMFTTAYAALPFLFLSTSLTLAKATKKHLAILIGVLFFASSAAYAPTLWYIMIASLILYFLPLVALKRKTYPGITKRFLLVLITIFLVNSFWLLPNVYFALNGASHVAEANINKLFSEEAFLKNKEFGTIESILSLKIFYFDWNIFDYSKNAFVQLTSAFQTHLQLPLVKVLVYLFAGSIFGGFLYSIKRFRQYSAGLILVLITALLFLFNDNQPSSFLFNGIRDHVPFFKEAFRFPENKIFNVFLFLTAIYFGLFQVFILNLLSKVKRLQKISLPFYSLLVAFGLLIYMLPAFQGNLIHPAMRVTIPKEYFELFKALEKEKGGRVANLPIHSPWGWVYHDWYGTKKPSFQGAGFLYFGVSQSLLERDFDRWESGNEQYFREMHDAIYSKNSAKLQRVISKYGISHVLIDTSIIAPGSDTTALFYSETNELLSVLVANGQLQKGQKFGKFITLYKVHGSSQFPLTTYKKVAAVNTKESAYFDDGIYSKHGTYANFGTGGTFPFENFLDNEFKTKIGKLSSDKQTLTISVPKADYKVTSTTFPSENIAASVVVIKNDLTNSLTVNLYPLAPLFDNTSLITPVKIELENANNNTFFSINEKVFITENLISNSPTLLGSTYLNSDSNMLTTYSSPLNSTGYDLSQLPITFSYCDQKQNGSLSALIEGQTLSLTADEKRDVCLQLPMYFLTLNSPSSLISIQFTTTTKGLSACLSENTSSSCSSTVEVVDDSHLKSLTFAATTDTVTNKKLILKIAKGNKKINLNNFQLSSSDGQTSISLENGLSPINPGSFQELTLPVPQDSSFTFEANTNEPVVNDCKSPVNSSVKTIQKRGTNNAFVYESEEGSFCDHIAFPDLPHELSYLVFIESKNVSGLPLSLCITNYTSRNCDIYAKLSTDKGHAQDTFFLPASDPDGRGYDVNLENTGINRSPSKNELYSIRFVPAPYSVLASIITGNVNSYAFPGSISNTEILTPSSLVFKTDGKPAYVDYRYSYQKGFGLYAVNCSNTVSCIIKTSLPFIFGEKINTHRQTNRWSNGWIVPQGLSSTQYIITYIPQYLEYFGLLLALTPFIFLFRYSWIKRTAWPLTRANGYFEKRSESLRISIYRRLHRRKK